MTLRLLDVLGPLVVIADGIHAQSDDLGVALVELGLQSGHVAELGRTDWGEILRMRAQDGPAVADPFVQADGALGGLRGEIRCVASDSQCHGLPPGVWTGYYHRLEADRASLEADCRLVGL